MFRVVFNPTIMPRRTQRQKRTSSPPLAFSVESWPQQLQESRPSFLRPPELPGASVARCRCRVGPSSRSRVVVPPTPCRSPPISCARLKRMSNRYRKHGRGNRVSYYVSRLKAESVSKQTTRWRRGFLPSRKQKENPSVLIAYCAIRLIISVFFITRLSQPVCLPWVHGITRTITRLLGKKKKNEGWFPRRWGKGAKTQRGAFIGQISPRYLQSDYLVCAPLALEKIGLGHSS